MTTRLFMIARFAINFLRISRRVSQKITLLKPQICLNTPAHHYGKLRYKSNGCLIAACLHFTNPNALATKTSRSSLPQVSKRRLHTNENETPSYPLLMDFPPKCIPNIFLVLRNVMNTYRVIKPAFHKDFTLPQFIEGAKQAIILVSEILANGEVEKLRGLVTQERCNAQKLENNFYEISPDFIMSRTRALDGVAKTRKAIQEIEKNLPRFSEAQRRDLAINRTRMNYVVPDKVGIIMEDGRLLVEITVVLWVNLKDVNQSFLQSWKIPSFTEYKELSEKVLTICNYRFIREYTKGVENNWIINALNHYKPEHFRKFYLK